MNKTFWGGRGHRHLRTAAFCAGMFGVAHTAAALTTCKVSATGMAFGSYQPLNFPGKLTSVDVASTADVTVECTGLLSLGGFSLALGPGTYGPGDRISTRYLQNTTNGGAEMAYNIYKDASYSSVWGNDTAGSKIVGFSADLLCILGICTKKYTVYGKVPSSQNTLKAGSFSDTLTITLTYSPLL
jgi:spore coat protein U-like protein